MGLPDEWLSGRADFDKLSEHAVFNDRWDFEDLARMINSVPDFAKARKDLQKFVKGQSGGENGRPALNDTFWSLFKAEPTVIDQDGMRPDHAVNWTVASEVLGLTELEKLRNFSVGDDLQAALSAAELEPTVESIFDRLDKEQKQSQELMDLLMQLAQAAGALDQANDELDQLMMELTGDGSPGEGEGQEGEGEPQEGDASGGGDGKGQEQELTDEQKAKLDAAAKAIREAQERFDEIQAEAAAKKSEIEEGLDEKMPSVKAELAEAMEQAYRDARDATDTANAWGVDPGQLRRMDAQERIELAKRLSNPRLREIADLYGQLHNVMITEVYRKTTNSREEIFDVERGHDLTHMLPSELMNLADEDAEWEFLRRFAESSLLQYALQGEERLGRGGIILCEDGSGSMSGAPERWAKAFMLCLLDLAKRQKRQMHVIHFGSAGQFKILEFTQPEHFSLENILDAAELFFSGGTDFATPMKQALKILDEEFGRTGQVRADVVFLTDDECWVDSEFMEHYLDEMKRMDATTWGVGVDHRPPSQGGPLDQMSEGKMKHITEFTGGEEARDMFRGIS